MVNALADRPTFNLYVLAVASAGVVVSICSGDAFNFVLALRGIPAAYPLLKPSSSRLMARGEKSLIFLVRARRSYQRVSTPASRKRFIARRFFSRTAHLSTRLPPQVTQQLAT